MATVAAALQLALQHHQAGDLQHAEALYKQILQSEPDQPDALHFLGVIAHQTGSHQLAVDLMTRSVALKPLNAVCHCNLGLTYGALGRLDDAMRCFEEAVRLEPRYADAFNNLGCVFADQGNQRRAVLCFEKALLLDGERAEWHYNLANAFFHLGRLQDAAASYQRALARRPEYSEAHNDLGNVLAARGKTQQAIHHYRQALSLDRHSAQAHSNLGNALKLLRLLEEAAESYRSALSVDPRSAETHFNLGRLLVEQNNLAEAISHLAQAAQLRPEMADAHAALGSILSESACTDEAALALVQKAPANDQLRLALATCLPAVYQSKSDVKNWRDRLQNEIRRLHGEGFRVDLTHQTAPPLFYLPYQGFDDCEFLREYAKLFRPPRIEGDSPPKKASVNSPGKSKIRIGLLSAFFKAHTIGLWFNGLVAQLSRDDFHVSVISLDRHADEVAQSFRRHADAYVELPRQLQAARRAILDQELDVLLYADIGLEAFSYTLAFSRLAPVQCVTLGHPVTTGLSSIDYFISTNDLETEDAEQRYTENLVRLGALPTYFQKPQIPATSKNRESFGLTAYDHVYVCLQSLFKFHPDFDRILGGILRGDPHGILLLSKGPVPEWERQLRQRFAVTLPDVLENIRFLPPMSFADYLNLLACADVQLDTRPFGGGNTSCDAFAVGLPVVTWPTNFMRGRITYALYKQMQILDCVAHSEEQYLAIALRLGMDREWRETIRTKLIAAQGLLYDNSAGVRELEEFFRQTVAKVKAKPGASKP